MQQKKVAAQLKISKLKVARPALPHAAHSFSDWTGSGLLKPFNSLLVPFVVASFSSVSTFPFQTTLSSSWRTKFTMVPLASILVRLNLFTRPAVRNIMLLPPSLGPVCARVFVFVRFWASPRATAHSVKTHAYLNAMLTSILPYRYYLLLRCHLRGYQCRDHCQRAG